MGIGSRYYRPVVAAFEAEGWQARALPRRGFELDSAPASRTHDWSYLDEVDDLSAAIAQARLDEPGRPILVLGHSLGGQLAVGHAVSHDDVDAVITVASPLPHYRLFGRAGLPIAFFAATLVPLLSRIFGHVPKPAFGAPGARTMMGDWATMVLTGRPPFEVPRRVAVPSLVLSLEGDTMAPSGPIDALAQRFFEPDALTRWHLGVAEAAGTSTDHVGWVRTPEAVVHRVVRWWGSVAPESSLTQP